MKFSKLTLGVFVFIATTAQSMTLNAKAEGDTIVFSGSTAITTNGFSIIPSFSLNSPAFISILSLRKDKFSFAPDIRLTPNLKKGGMIFWLRYQLVNKKRFGLLVGVHPALNFQLRDITVNGKTTTISQMRRFVAWAVAPNFRLTKRWSAGVFYLNGNGLQLDGPQTTHFVTLNTAISNIRISRSLRYGISAAVFHLDIDGKTGQYFTATNSLRHLKYPFALESSINQTLRSNLPGNKDFMWNISLNYLFSKGFVRVR